MMNVLKDLHILKMVKYIKNKMKYLFIKSKLDLHLNIAAKLMQLQ